MEAVHQNLAAGESPDSWQRLTLMEQLGNIGSEVSRALRAKEQGQEDRLHGACDRMWELFDFTIADTRFRGRLKEILRLREVLCDYFYGSNVFQLTPALLQKDFLYYGIAARRKRM